MKRLPRCWTAAVTIVALAFTQLALAALPCAGTMQDAAPMERFVAGCDRVDSQSMPLCQHHCQQAAQSLDKPQLPAVAPAPLAGVVAAPAILPALSRRETAPPAISRATHPPAPPPNTCLRI